MKKNVPNEDKVQTILDLICALDGRILKVVHDDGLLIVYANVMPYEDEDDSDDEELTEDEYGEPGEEGETFEDEDYGDYADCYHTCEDYRAVSEEDWRCVNFCTKCQSCMQDAA